jgi:PAS domain S-box-containing protein
MTSFDPRLAYGGLPVMMWTANGDRGCDYFNQRRLEFTGRRLDEEQGWGWSERVHPDDRAATLAAFRAALRGRRPFSHSYRLQRADGEYRWMTDTAVPPPGVDGSSGGLIGCSTDVTEHRTLQERVERLERSDAIAQLAGGVAHDFNNLLTGILGHVSLLLEDASLSLEARSDLGQIQRSADRAAGLTRQLLAFSRRQALAPRPLDLNRLVSGTVSAIRGLVGSRIDVIQVLAHDLDPVLADPGQLEQVLLQLGSHARAAMPSGGRLELRTAPVQVDPSPATDHPGPTPGTYVSLVVEYAGAGVTPTMPDAIGLASVHGVVKQSGGYMEMTDTPGTGTTFTLHLRRVDSRPAGSSGSDLDATSALAGTGTVLLVEDEEQVRELARRVLERAGYTVLTATDAELAMAIADRHPGHIHLLITDVVLPHVSGRELAARLGIHRPAIKVLYVSGAADDAIARHRMLEPGTEFLEKPFSLEGLLRRVRKVLGAPEPAPRPA